MREVGGIRLDRLIGGSGDLKSLPPIYKELGSRVGYISKRGVKHGHLHTGNVWVENALPVVTDWWMGKLLPETPTDPDRLYEFWMWENSEPLLQSTRSGLETRARHEVAETGEEVDIRQIDELNKLLKGNYSEAFSRELLS